MFVSRRWGNTRTKELENVYTMLKDLDEDLKQGQRYKIQYIAGKRNSGGTNNFEGTLIEKLDKYLVFRNILGYKECFLKIDFIIREYSIEEVE